MGYEQERRLTLKECALELGLSEGAFRKRVERGEVPGVVRDYQAKRVWVTFKGLEEYKRKQNQIPTKEEQMSEIKEKTLEAIRETREDTGDERTRERELRESFADLIADGRKTRAGLQALDAEFGHVVGGVMDALAEFNVGVDDKKIHTIKELANGIHKALSSWPGQISSGILGLEEMTLKQFGDRKAHDTVAKVRGILNEDVRIKADIERLYDLLAAVDLATWIRDRRDRLAINAGKGTLSPGSIAGEKGSEGVAVKRPSDHPRRQTRYKTGDEE